jgi:septum formation protein
MQFELDSPKARYKGHVVLASSSERRRRLMEDAGYDFEVIVPSLKEDRLHPQDPLVLAESLAYAKARQVADRLERHVVIGADTVVSLGGRLIGKPADEAEAREILRRLSGSTHEVITGVCLVNARRGERLLGSEITRVVMKNLSEAELDAYVRSGESIGKAGAYAIQENGDRFVERIDGSFTNVVGLPMLLLARMLDVMKKLIYPETAR